MDDSVFCTPTNSGDELTVDMASTKSILLDTPKLISQHMLMILKRF